MKVEHSAAAAIKELTEEQLDTAIAAIHEMLDRRTAAAQMIEGHAEVKRVPEPDGTGTYLY